MHGVTLGLWRGLDDVMGRHKEQTSAGRIQQDLMHSLIVNAVLKRKAIAAQVVDRASGLCETSEADEDLRRDVNSAVRWHSSSAVKLDTSSASVQ